jgi:hypothetical protein
MDGAVPLRKQETHMSNFENMNKDQLRAACRTAGIVYGKMNNTQMRDALVAAQPKPASTHVVHAGPEVKPALVAAVVDAIAKANTPETVVISQLTTPAPVATPAPAPKTSGKKIQKDREERNGVKRPSAGTICAAIWSALDAKRAELSGGMSVEGVGAAKSGTVPSFKDLKALQDTNGWERNTAVTQYQRWKEFNDLMVR